MQNKAGWHPVRGAIPQPPAFPSGATEKAADVETGGYSPAWGAFWR